MLRFRPLQKEFSAAAWRNRAQLDDFVERAAAADAGDLAKLVPLLANLAGVTRDQRRNRIQAFILLTDGKTDARLFPPLFKLTKEGDEAVRRVLLPVMARTCDARQHSEIAALLTAPDANTRRWGATLMKSVGGGKPALRALTSVLKKPGGPRMEAMHVAMEIGGHYAIEIVAPVLENGSTQERLAALRLIGDVRYVKAAPRKALETIAPLLHDDHMQIVVEAIKAYGALAPEDEFYGMVGEYFISGQDQRHQLAAIRCLGQFRSRRTVLEFTRIFRVANRTVREATVEILEEIGSDEVLPLIIDAMGDELLSVRNAALATAINLGKQRKVDMGRMLLWLLRSNDLKVKRQAVEIVAQVGESLRELWPRLLDMLRDEDWWVRERVVEALMTIAGEELTRHVAGFLNDERAVIRRWAVEVLMRIKDPRSLGALVRAAGSDEDWWVRERAVEAMGEIGDARVLPHILKLAENDATLVWAAVSALGHLQDPDGLRFLCRALRHDDSDLRFEALDAILAIGDPAAAPYVEPLLEDDDARVRRKAEDLLMAWQGMGAVGGEAARRLEGLEKLLFEVVEAGGDDLFLISGRPPTMKRLGSMEPMGETPLSPEEVETTLRAVLTPMQIRNLENLIDVDFSMEVKAHGLRFRANVFQQLAGWTAVFRSITEEIHTFEQLGLPDIVRTLCDLPHGLVLVGGPTGSGKTTTLAAMIDYINTTYGKHVITIEDPIEVVHPNKLSLVTQREVGSHTESFAAALRSTLREDPDVILVGEMRDLETIAFAISAAETGHLVLGTVHTVSAETTMDRLIDAFPVRAQQQVRAQISQTLRAVLCQQLLRRKDQDDGRIAAIEVLINNDAVANIIRKGQCFQLPSVVATHREQGMRSMDHELQRLYREGLVHAEEVYVRAINKKEMESFLGHEANGAS
ncbi:MAG: PilT/PilU family type 4a pilus ATPase [Proteobacteria bacterium]|nr:PilT/PilU family type 4a pilus ATPase [Pseudomonadota bacterium]